jgi:hypothetical protein
VGTVGVLALIFLARSIHKAFQNMKESTKLQQTQRFVIPDGRNKNIYFFLGAYVSLGAANDTGG